MKKVTSRIIAVLVAAMMACAMLPVNALAADATDEAVAQIDGNNYTSFADALNAANETNGECTITLLENTTSDTLIQTKNTENNIIIDLNDKTLTINRTFTHSEWYVNGYGVKGCLTFKNGAIRSAEQNASGETFTVTKTGTLSFENCDVNIGGNEAYTAVYNENIVNITGGSFKVSNTSGTGDAFYSDYRTSQLNIKKAKIVIDNTSRFDVMSETLIEDSVVTITNLSAIGMNAANTTMRGSTLTMDKVKNHGYTNGILKMYDSKMSLKNCGNIGANVVGDSLMDNSELTISECGGVETLGRSALVVGLSQSVSDAKFEITKNSELTVTNNKQGGIYVAGKLEQDDTSKVTIIKNEITSSGKYNAGKGGGVHNIGIVTLQPNAVLYNNHAEKAGDDIYNLGTITFGATGQEWALDGEPDCTDAIDGWYKDGQEEGKRWEAHAKVNENNYTELVEAGTITTGAALKAAHGFNAEEKTSYPSLEKKIVEGEEEKDSTSVSKDDTVNFKLTSNVPQDLKNYLKADPAEGPEVEEPENGIAAYAYEDAKNSGTYKLTFHDQMDSALTLNEDSIKVTVNGKELPNTLYKTNYEATEETPCTFHVTMDLVEIYNAKDAEGNPLNYFTEAEFGTAPIVVTYSATANKVTSGAYHNTAWVEFEGDSSQPDDVTVNVYGIKIFKYDQTDDEGLAGAEFDLKQGEDVVATLTSGKDGYVSVDGLKAGSYTLTETKAPAGYVKSNEPLEIVLPDDATDHIATVKFANSMIPHTGGSGTGLYTTVGVIVIAAAAILFLVTWRRRREND